MAGQWASFDLVEEPERSLGRFLEDLGPVAVVNCMSAIQGTREDMQRLNVDLVRKLLSALASCSSGAPGPPRVAAEYGPSPDATAPAEPDEPHPVGDYAATKLAGTELVREAAESGRVSATVLRVFNPLGAGAPPGSLVGRAVGSLQEALAPGSQQIKLGALDSARDLRVDVRDIAGPRSWRHAGRTGPGNRWSSTLAAASRSPAVGSSTVWPPSPTSTVRSSKKTAAYSTRSATVPWQWADTAAVPQTALDASPPFGRLPLPGVVGRDRHRAGPSAPSLITNPPLPSPPPWSSGIVGRGPICSSPHRSSIPL